MLCVGKALKRGVHDILDVQPTVHLFIGVDLSNFDNQKNQPENVIASTAKDIGADIVVIVLDLFRLAPITATHMPLNITPAGNINEPGAL